MNSLAEDCAWIISCINSSTNTFHLQGCYKLQELFEEKHKHNSNYTKYAGVILDTIQAKESLIIVSV